MRVLYVSGLLDSVVISTPVGLNNGLDPNFMLPCFVRTVCITDGTGADGMGADGTGADGTGADDACVAGA